MDLPDFVDIGLVAMKMDLWSLTMEWKIMPCCAVTGEGLFEGLDWLSEMCK